ncbi:MAG: DUF4870 domain-containing protein [Leptolyngbya sp. DLM2.Bin27]|nr:MAG: DUF4870 domain-containing protein [Leptolyngbya sp. DLM2.Bin27]
MSSPLPSLLDRARQGDAQAIAQLLTEALAPQQIVAQGQWQGAQLQLTLEADTAILRPQVMPRVRQGIQRLGPACPVDSVQVRARRVGAAAVDWQESFGCSGKEDLGHNTSSLPQRSAVSHSPAPGQPPTPISVGNPQPVDPSDMTLASLIHLMPLLSYLAVGSQWVVGWPLFLGGAFLLPWRVVPPLVVLLVKGRRPDSALAPRSLQRQAKAALNFQLTMVIAWLVTIGLMFVVVGFLLVVPLLLFEMVSCIIAAVHASEGQPPHYVGAIRFVR